jgi:ABC-type Fe3+-hydroxamate transport system substrate-binding protein
VNLNIIALGMRKSAIYGIVAALAVAAGIGIAFAAMNMNNNNNTIEPAVAQQQPPSNQVRVINHTMGETEITGTPKRVVTLYSVFTGDVRALGVQPVGSVDREWINGWLTPIGLPLSDNVTELGRAAEPNLETILELQPDLIIGLGGAWGDHDEMYEELNDIAPTIILDDQVSNSSELNELDVGKSNFMTIADALNRHDAGVAYIQNVESKYDEAAARIQQAGMNGTKFVMVYGWMPNDVPGAYVFTQNSFVSKVLNNIGLVNEIPDPTDTNDKWYQTGMEGLTTVDKPDTHFFVTYDAGMFESNPLVASPLWDDLNVVKEGRAHDIGPTRVFGQVIFIEDILDRVVNALTEDNQVRVIKHAMGETEITGIPTRIVSLSWQSGADLLTLGVQPVGLGNAGTFNETVNLEQVTLPSGVADVGAPWEPNLEAIAQLEPDLIIGSMHDNELLYNDLSEIAPTVLSNVFVQSPEQDIPNELELMKQNFIATADLVGKRDQGVAIIDRMNAKFDEARGKLAEAGIGGSKFVLGYVQEDATSMWIWIDALNTQVLEEMGLENAYKAAYNDTYEFGGTAVGLEGLTIVNDPNVHFIFRQHATDTGIPDSWQNNPVWNNFEFVKAGQANPHESLYVYAGPVAAEALADTVVELLTGNEDAN